MWQLLGVPGILVLDCGLGPVEFEACDSDTGFSNLAVLRLASHLSRSGQIS